MGCCAVNAKASKWALHLLIVARSRSSRDINGPVKRACGTP